MTDIYRHRVAWTGFTGAPGVSTFYGLVDGTLVTSLRAFFASLVTLFPPSVNLQVESAGDILEDTTGVITGAWTATPVLPVVGTGAALHAAPVGASVAWLTSTILDGHRLKGRTYLVPLGSDCFAGDGTLDGPRMANIAAAAVTFVAAEAGDLVVWHRPRIATAATAYHPAVTARAGGHGLVTGSSVADVAAVLTSRRD